MLSGEFSTIRCADVIVRREDRIRKRLTEESIAELADSIKRLGLIHPIVLDRENVLVAGETRLTACRLLGWEEIPFQYLDNLSKAEALGLELEENVARKDLDWKDRCEALLRLHELKKETESSWTLNKTAKLVGYSDGATSQMISVAKELLAGNEKIANAGRYSAAAGMIARAKEREAADVITSINKITAAPSATSEEIQVGDFLKWAPNYTGLPFNLLHVDFPYGVDFDKSGYTSGAVTGHYKDSKEIYWALTRTLLENAERLAGDSCHMVFWFSMKFYQPTLEALREKFKVNPTPLIWVKSDNKGIIPNANYDPRHIYETAFLCSRGDRKLIQPVADAFYGPTEKIADHASEKSETMLRHFFRMFVDSNTRLLDPTCGSGSAVRAAKALGAGSVLGLELNEVFAADARRALNERTNS